MFRWFGGVDTPTVTPFCLDHVFRAPSIQAVFAAYFDAEHQLEQDRCVAIAERTVVELDDRGDELRRVCRIVPSRQLPALVKPFVSGPLHYTETVLWRRAADALAIDITMLGGRVVIAGTYRLERVGPAAIHRRYAGEVSVDVALLSARIERGIVAELERSIPRAADCTQAWLDGRPERSLSARA